jgi:chaperonin GroEL
MHYLHRVDFSKSYLYQSLLVDSFLYLQAAVEEGIVVGGGCTLLRLSSKVDAIIETLENDEQKVGSKV